MTLPFFQKPSISTQWGFKAHELLASMLECWLAWSYIRSCEGNHNSCEFIRVTVLLHLDQTVLLTSCLLQTFIPRFQDGSWVLGSSDGEIDIPLSLSFPLKLIVYTFISFSVLLPTIHHFPDKVRISLICWYSNINLEKSLLTCPF